MFDCFRDKNYCNDEDETIFLRNGSMLLEKLISFCDGNCNPIRSFSVEELNRATNNYDEQRIIMDDGDLRFYKGLLQDRPVIVKKFKHDLSSASFRKEIVNRIVNEIVFSSVFSAQKHVLKLLGCCLTTELPIGVFEYAENKTLEDHIFSSNNGCIVEPLSLKCRLKIAVDVSTVVAYLHNNFPRPVVHRSITPSSIFIDKNGVAKLADFTLSISIPEGKFEIEDETITGRIGYMAPEHRKTARFNEMTDVYSFGAVLLALLSGRKPWEFNIMLIKEAITDSDHSQSEILPNRETMGDIVTMDIEHRRLNEIVDSSILKEGTWPGKVQQLQALATIAVQCLCEEVQDRPAMIEVAKQLREIYRSLISSN